MRRRTSRLIVFALLGVVAAGTAYEAAVAVGVIGLGAEPGEGPARESIFLTAAIAALLFGAVLVLGYVAQPVRAPRLVVLLPLAGAGFALARFYAFDPYFAPTLRRASEDGLVPASWIASLVLLSALAALATTMRARVGLALTVAALLASALTAFAVRLGH